MTPTVIKKEESPDAQALGLASAPAGMEEKKSTASHLSIVEIKTEENEALTPVSAPITDLETMPNVNKDATVTEKTTSPSGQSPFTCRTYGPSPRKCTTSKGSSDNASLRSLVVTPLKIAKPRVTASSRVVARSPVRATAKPPNIRARGDNTSKNILRPPARLRDPKNPFKFTYMMNNYYDSVQESIEGSGETTLQQYVSQFEIQHLDNVLQSVKQDAEIDREELSRQRIIVNQISDFNENIYTAIIDLRERMEQVEQENIRLRSMLVDSNRYGRYRDAMRTGFRGTTDDRSRSPSRDLNPAVEIPGKDKKRDAAARFSQKLKLQIGDEVAGLVPSSAALPTPLTLTGPHSSTVSLSLTSPKTPRIGPSTANSRCKTSLSKRPVHNLDGMIPPHNVQLPLIPITDVELIVYFFNSLTRPIAALRLYSRGWGPASITNTLNDYRSISPPYLRNTCSVKCVTAIKQGKKKHGETWYDAHKAVFAEANDCKATDLIRLSGPELKGAVDYGVLDLCLGLKKHPQGDDAGIFTQCVEWCEENNAGFLISNLVELAMDLEAGRTPRAPSSPGSEYNARFRREMNFGAGNIAEGDTVFDEEEDSVIGGAVGSPQNASFLIGGKEGEDELV